jgi:hypothetical protein
MLECDVLSLYIADFAKSSPKRVHKGGGGHGDALLGRFTALRLRACVGHGNITSPVNETTLVPRLA